MGCPSADSCKLCSQAGHRVDPAMRHLGVARAPSPLTRSWLPFQRQLAPTYRPFLLPSLSLQPPRSSPLPRPTLSPPPPRWLAPHASPPPCGARRCQGRTRLSAGRPRPKPPQEASSSGFLSSHRARGSSLPRSPPPQAGRTSRVAQGAACFPSILNFAKVSRISKERSHYQMSEYY